MNYDIKLPVLEDLDGYEEILYIEQSSNKNQKQALELIAYYFKREFNYDNLQYCAKDLNDDCVGILFVERATDLVKHDEHYPNRVIGGACFRKENDNYFLDWIWLHPFARNRKKLSGYWPGFKSKFRNFEVTPPLSAHMSAFIEKHETTTLQE